MKPSKDTLSPASMPVAYAPLVDACAAHGISRTVAFELAAKGLLQTFRLGRRRYVSLASLYSLPERLAAKRVDADSDI